MAKVRNAGKPKKQILDQTAVWGKENQRSAKKGKRREFLTVFG
jgi:hypothetical protein